MCVLIDVFVLLCSFVIICLLYIFVVVVFFFVADNLVQALPFVYAFLCGKFDNNNNNNHSRSNWTG